MRSLCLALLLSVVPVAAESPAEATLAEARQQMEARHYGPALDAFRRVLRVEPRNPEALYNGGLSAYLNNDFQAARDLWLTYTQVAPDNWRGLDKLIQAEQALGDQRNLQTHIALLTARYKAGRIPELMEERSFVRHQVRDGQHEVYAFQFFDPDYKKREHTYDFVVQDAKTDQRLAMYYLMFDEAASGGGKKLWFLDVREANGRRPLTCFGYKPTFEECLDSVRRSLAGEKLPRWQEKPPAR